MNIRRIATAGLILGITGSATGAVFDARSMHEKLVGAFNDRQWQDVRAMLADDVVFHRANSQEVFAGPDAVVRRFQETIGAPDQWNVKFAIVESKSEFAGTDGRVVEYGDFALTAGADDASCYRGSYMMTWVPQTGSEWRLQMFAWQDVETDLANCR